MVNITELVSQIRDLGQRVLELESGLGLMQRVKDGQADSRAVYLTQKHIGQCVNEFIMLKSALKQATVPPQDYQALAFSLLDHDFIGMVTPLSDTSSILFDFLE